MATPKKKHLIELMIEAGVEWPEGAEYAAQDKKNLRVNFYRNGKPNIPKGGNEWLFVHCNFMRLYGLVLPSLCCNWHQTIVTREQYAEAVAAAGNGEQEQKVTYQDIADHRCFSCDTPADAVEWHNSPSIEQLTADYHAKAAEADRLQAVADEALKAADEALLALEKAGELIGLVISIDTKPKQVDQQCSSAEWKIGDKCIVTSSPDDSDWVGRECLLTKIDRSDSNLTYRVTSKEGGDYWVSGIRRP